YLGILLGRVAALFACACAALGFALAAGHAQTPVKPVPKFESEPFAGSELLAGKRITESECIDLPGAVCVVVHGKGECLRYYHSTAGGSGSDAVVFLGPDQVSVNGRGEAKPY